MNAGRVILILFALLLGAAVVKSQDTEILPAVMTYGVAAGGGGGGGSDYTSTLIGWYKADNIASNNNDRLTIWADASSAGYNATNAGGTVSPTYKTSVVNGHAVVNFDVGTGNQYFVTQSFTQTNQPLTVVALVRSTLIFGSEFIWDGISETHSLTARFTGTRHIDTDSGGGNTLDSGGSFSDLEWVFVVATYNGASSSLTTNGVTAATGDQTSSSGNFTGFTIGSNSGRTVSLHGDIAEWRCYGEALSGENLTTVKTYFSTTYGITIQ